MKQLKWFTVLMVLVLIMPLMPAAIQPSGASESVETWYIVEFEDPALAVYAKSSTASTMMEGSKLSVEAAASRDYVGKLQAQQAEFKADLAKVMPGAEVTRGYQIVLDAVAVRLPNADPAAIKALRSMPNVASVSPQVMYSIDLDYSLPLIDAPALWAELGGQDVAGAGIKVADIDTGIDPTHPMFSGEGFSFPTVGAWPKGVASFCNGKIIAARYYEPTFDVNAGEELTPRDMDGHGSHTAGIAVGNQVTATYGTAITSISGAAPGAWLMVYKALFENSDGTNATGSNIMLAAAIEDAVADGADVVNNSWGSTDILLPANDPLGKAYEAAADAGLVIVFSNGNSGPNYNTTGSPTSPKFIKVGASTTKRAFYNTISVTAPEPVAEPLQSFPGNQFQDLGPKAVPPTGALPYIPCDLKGNVDTTVPGVTADIASLDPYINGWIALIPRGTYNFTDKLDNAITAGASAVIMYTDDRTWKGGFTATGRDIYTVMIDHDLGLEVLNWWETYTDTARIQIGYPVSPWTTEIQDQIADFSSRGPTVDMLISPDVVAPGVNILSAKPGFAFQPLQGTSMAAPHVTGSVALLIELHPDWTPAQIKSALMTTAYEGVLDTNGAVADVMTQGAGRIDVAKAGDPGFTVDKPSLSFGELPMGSTETITFTATNVSGMAETYSLSVEEAITATGSVTISVSPIMTFANDGMDAIAVHATASMDAVPGDLEGNVVISGTEHVAHIPYWIRVTPPKAAVADVLLIDMDFSSWPYTAGNPWGLSFGNYLSYYTSTLETVGLTYDVWDVVMQDAPTRAVLDNYDKVVLFTGDYFGIFPYKTTSWGLYSYDMTAVLDDVRNYLAAGGKMLVSGQDAIGIDGLASYMRGANDAPLQDGIFPGAIPKPSIVGDYEYNPFLYDVMLDLSAGGDGAGNQAFVDELEWLDFVDLDTAPLFEVANTVTGTVQLGIVATRSSFEPTIARTKNPQVDVEPVSWRVVYLGFGLEGVNDNTGFSTRADVLQACVDWMDDEASVSLDVPMTQIIKTMGYATFSATLTSTLGGEDARYYAWDFGDGSDIVYTAENTTSHQYKHAGTYTVYVETMDMYSHGAVATPVIVIVADNASYVQVPLLMR